MAGLDATELARAAARFPMPRVSRTLRPYDHFTAMVFAQLTYRESLRGIETCLSARPALAYQMGIRGRVTRTNLAYANDHRDWRVFAEIAGVLMRRAQRPCADLPPELGLEADLFALDATVIELSLALFSWARWKKDLASVKLNVLLDLRGGIPVFASLHEGKHREMASLDALPVQAGGYYVMDRGYLDFARLPILPFVYTRCPSTCSIDRFALAASAFRDNPQSPMEPVQDTFQTKTTRVYSELKRDISSGIYRPGQHLVRREMVKRFGVSLSIVNEALARLGNDGLVEMKEMYGTRVIALNEKNLNGEFVLREAIERHVARLLAEHGTKEIFESLLEEARIVDRWSNDVGQDSAQGSLLHLEFHLKLARSTGYPLLEETLKRTSIRTLLTTRWITRQNKVPHPPDFHEQLVLGIMQGDPAIADQKMKEHLLFNERRDDFRINEA